MKTTAFNKGWRTFYTIWGGQAVSLIGSAMSRFALTIWAYQQTGAATTLALLGFFNYGAFVACSPLAGLLVDRYNREIHYAPGRPGGSLDERRRLCLIRYRPAREIWHLYVMETISGGW